MIPSSSSPIAVQIFNYYRYGLPIKIETAALCLMSVQASDLPFYQKIYTDPDTMKLYADCGPRLQEKGEAAWKDEQMTLAAKRVATFIKRWYVDNNPLSEFVIWKKENQISSPIGFITAGCVGKPGKVEAAMVICKEAHGQAYGTQAITALIHHYLPALIETHAKIFGRPFLADGAPLQEVFATARPDNHASIRVMEKLGMTKTGDNQPSAWGGPRVLYSLQLQERAKL